jgi:hypothetical protein
MPKRAAAAALQKTAGDVGRPMFIGFNSITPHKTFLRIFVFFAQTLYQKGFGACGGSLFP